MSQMMTLALITALKYGRPKARQSTRVKSRKSDTLGVFMEIEEYQKIRAIKQDSLLLSQPVL